MNVSAKKEMYKYCAIPLSPKSQNDNDNENDQKYKSQRDVWNSRISRLKNL